ncbi:hypothetical protein [Paraburkholderia atlantica]|uniref:Uncharacterized protein n=1 Tax=Paraburkholderia atlantica TaxID=2654982 RepID=D5WNC0_PARAM|nr:hypothetical protein [Paraburkholderia atlantica]ADG20799.1 hypothetical protein BC1002_7019 [Paraburkholderia atlantica]MBB5511113.1 hypothetical protein [Paraburkholderia atlantica]
MLRRRIDPRTLEAMLVEAMENALSDYDSSLALDDDLEAVAQFVAAFSVRVHGADTESDT